MGTGGQHLCPLIDAVDDAMLADTAADGRVDDGLTTITKMLFL